MHWHELDPDEARDRLAHEPAADTGGLGARMRKAAEGVKIIGEAFPIPGKSFGQRRAGMSSTASIRSISSLRCSLRTGAKPTPQLPNRIVVTPCQEEGANTGSQVGCPW